MHSIRYSGLALILATLMASHSAIALDFGGLVKGIGGKLAGDKAVEATTDALTADDEAPQGDSTAAAETPETPETPETAGPITSEALAVPMKDKRGSAEVFSKRPRVALVGYNVGAFQTANVKATTSRGQGATVNMSLTLQGIDEPLLQKIADAAEADLVSQLQGAGIEVIDAKAFFASPESADIYRSGKSLSGKPARGGVNAEMLVVGPSEVGVVQSFGLIPKGFGMPGHKSSAALDAIVVYPNLAIDFAWTSGGGRTMLKQKVSVDAGSRFALDQMSSFVAIYSKDGRFVDESATFGIEEDLGVDDSFATVVAEGSSDNGLAVGLSHALGVGMGSNKGSKYVVDADPERYEALALNAARGFNTALVERVKAAHSL